MLSITQSFFFHDFIKIYSWKLKVSFFLSPNNRCKKSIFKFESQSILNNFNQSFSFEILLNLEKKENIEVIKYFQFLLLLLLLGFNAFNTTINNKSNKNKRE